MKHMCVKIRYIYIYIYIYIYSLSTVTCCQDLELLYESSLNKLFYFSAVTFSPVYFKNLCYNLK